MALIQGSTVDVISGLNRETLATLERSGFLLSPVFPVDTDPTGQVVKIRLTCVPEYQYQGTAVIQYNRLPFTDLASKFPVLPNISPKATLYEMLEAFRDSTSVNLSEDDVEDAPIETLEDGTYQVQLTAKPGSHGWYGTGTFPFRDLPPLSLVVTDVSLGWK